MTVTHAIALRSVLRRELRGERINAHARRLGQCAQHVQIGLAGGAKPRVLKRRLGRLAIKQRADFRRGQTVEGMTLVDLVPTVLYYLGLPVGRDMDGIVRGALFERDFTDLNPVLQISSYEEVAVRKRISE